MPYLDDAAKAARNRYYREYRAKNKEKIREIRKRYWEKKAAESKEKEEADSDEQRECSTISDN